MQEVKKDWPKRIRNKVEKDEEVGRTQMMRGNRFQASSLLLLKLHTFVAARAGRKRADCRRWNRIKKQLMYPQRTRGRNTSDPWLASLMTGKTETMSPAPVHRREVQPHLC